MFDMKEMLKKTKSAQSCLRNADTVLKNKALECMADALEKNTDSILASNSSDMEKAKGVISDVMCDRLMLNSDRIKAMADGIREVAKLPDPVGLVLDEHTRNDGLKITKVSVSLGVIAIIYESRPNVTSDAAALAVKSGNCCVLRSGKEAFNSALSIVGALKQGLKNAGLDENCINLVGDTSHESANTLMTANGYIDLLIPRGGAGLINACVRNATVPCIATGTGICHVYVEKSADFEMALNIIENAKTSRPSVCNAEEVLLVDKAIAERFLPLVKERLVDRRVQNGLIPVELRLDSFAASFIDGKTAGEKDFDTEFLDYILAVKCVDGYKEAVEHISAHSTGHSEAIVTSDSEASRYFTQNIDSAAVYVNSSTRFTDGGEFGLGCEMGISTQKLHARGPMGLRELTTYKYVVYGNGNIR
ncbi:MAG: glutamate-5-semialdehyde dehydrogenase [Ruminococcaceae bacterium]|nr:glutamate-5-semialdehyde dehydrogenase [Oscillospiraceae bacterium]